MSTNWNEVAEKMKAAADARKGGERTADNIPLAWERKGVADYWLAGWSGTEFGAHSWKLAGFNPTEAVRYSPALTEYNDSLKTKKARLAVALSTDIRDMINAGIEITPATIRDWMKALMA